MHPNRTTDDERCNACGGRFVLVPAGLAAVVPVLRCEDCRRDVPATALDVRRYLLKIGSA